MSINTIENNDVLSTILDHVASRGAILFLGSGFSSSAHGLKKDEMPIAKELAQKIGDLQGFDAENDLRYATSRYLSTDGDKNKLINMLHETFTVTDVKDHHIAIASAPWRRVYTTNYDLCFEKAAEKNRKIVTTVDMNSNPSTYTAKNEICIHLNGSLLSLTAESLDNDFKLTTSSYLSPNSFLNSKWFYTFQRDLEFSTAIIFVGYSMYDIEVQKILHNNPHYTNKTYFITRSLKGGRDQFTLEQFGKILPIGVIEFANAIQKKSIEFTDEPEDLMLASLWEYDITDNDVGIRDKNVDDFLMYGKTKDSLIESSIKGVKGAPLLIHREDITQALELIKANANIVVTAEFGNGKSTFLRELRVRLTLEGKRVFISDKYNPYQHDDLDQLVKKDIKGVLIIDAYDQNLELLKHYAELNPSNLKLIISARTSIHERNRPLFQEIGLKLNEVSIDELSTNEVDSFIEIIDNMGYWGDVDISSKHEKYKSIKKHKNVISQNLLFLLSSPQIVDRVSEIIHDLLLIPEYKDTIFAIALLSANNMPLSSSLISEIALNEAIYTTELRSNDKFQQIFQLNGTLINTKSSIFAILLISHQYSSTYTVDQLLKIVAHLDGKSGELREMQKNLMRFSVVERLLQEAQRKQSLIRYYEHLKREVPWLQYDPHFWLQYGMSHLTHKDFSRAQANFNQAYALAEKKIYEHTDHIDNQQARLYLLQSASENDASKSFQLFNKAHQLIVKQPEDIHKYRQVELYKDVFEKDFNSFSNSNKSQFESACKIVLRDLTLALNDGKVISGRQNAANKLSITLNTILQTIKLSKSST